MICIQLGVLIALILLRIALWNAWQDKGSIYKNMATIIPSVIISLVINIMNQIYAHIAYLLTNFENHKS